MGRSQCCMDMGALKRATRPSPTTCVELIAAELAARVSDQAHGRGGRGAGTVRRCRGVRYMRALRWSRIMGHVDHGRRPAPEKAIRRGRGTRPRPAVSPNTSARTRPRSTSGRSRSSTPRARGFHRYRARGRQGDRHHCSVVAPTTDGMPQTLDSISHARAAEVPTSSREQDRPAGRESRPRAPDLAAQAFSPRWGRDDAGPKVSAEAW